MLAGGPDVLFVGGASEPTGLVIKQARELGFKGGFAIMDQPKMDEIAKVVAGLEPLDGAVGVLPLAYDDCAPAQNFVKRYRARYPNDPNFEASLNYTALYVVADAMKLADSGADAKMIRAKVDQSAKALPPDDNPNGLAGVGSTGGFETSAFAAAVENGKIKPVPLSEATQ